MLFRKEYIQVQIQILKRTKKDPNYSSCATELIRATGYVNIIDILLLPLYYTWEHIEHGSIKDVGFEPYLIKTYRMFCKSVEKYTQKIMGIMIRTLIKKNLSLETKLVVDSLVKTQSYILKTITVNSNKAK